MDSTLCILLASLLLAAALYAADLLTPTVNELKPRRR